MRTQLSFDTSPCGQKTYLAHFWRRGSALFSGTWNLKNARNVLRNPLDSNHPPRPTSNAPTHADPAQRAAARASGEPPRARQTRTRTRPRGGTPPRGHGAPPAHNTGAQRDQKQDRAEREARRALARLCCKGAKRQAGLAAKPPSPHAAARARAESPHVVFWARANDGAPSRGEAAGSQRHHRTRVVGGGRAVPAWRCYVYFHFCDVLPDDGKWHGGTCFPVEI